MSLLDRRAFFMTGAGSSAGAPTGLPTGPQLSARLVQWARDIGCGDALDGTDESDLGEVCAALEGAIERDQLARHLGQDVDWADSEFNLCHLAIALFFAEQLMRVGFTVNWDPKIDDAIAVVANGKRPKIAHDPQTMSSVGSDPFLLHMHGRWSDPDSLVMTNAELDKPEAIKWTDPNLRATLSSNDPIFVGFAAEPGYVIRSLSEMRAEMKGGPASVIGLQEVEEFCAGSTALAEALGLINGNGHYIQGSACEVMGELLRCCYRRLLRAVFEEAEAKARAGGGTARAFTDAGAKMVRSALEALTMESLLGLLWSSAARTTSAGASRQATLQSLTKGLAETLAIVMVLSSCSDTAALSASRHGFRLRREDGFEVDLWPAVPEEELSPTDASARAYQHSDRFSGPADAGVPLVLICGGTSGAVPGSDKISLISKADTANVRVGQRTPAGVIDFTEVDRRFGDAGSDPTLERGLTIG